MRSEIRRILSIVCLILSGTSTPLLAADPLFETHFIQKDSPLVTHAVMSVTLSDLDQDGDLDWTVGTVWPRIGNVKPSRNLDQRQLFWFEYRAPDNWIRHTIGKDADAYGAACTADVNSDGRVDFIAPNLWLNQGGGRWQFFRTGIGDGGHDLQSIDINSDGQTDLLAFTQQGGLNWFEMPADLSKPWIRHKIGPADYAGARVHACSSPVGGGDLDGDGDNDVAGVFGWFENQDGTGTAWRYHKHDLFPLSNQENFPWGYAVKTVVCDVDGDGDNDVIQSECDTPMSAGIVWLENSDGKGNFVRHWIAERSVADYHSLSMLDYDLDGDLDVLSGVGPLATENPKAALLFENTLRKKMAGKNRGSVTRFIGVCRSTKPPRGTLMRTAMQTSS